MMQGMDLTNIQRLQKELGDVTAMIELLVDKNVSYLQVEQIALSGKINQLKSINLFDVFESEKLGAGKKSLAVSFTFQDEHKTLTDGEIDQYMNQLVQQYQTHLKAEIRK
jgi:phenylalanyl-tRNA synthetase beta chain